MKRLLATTWSRLGLQLGLLTGIGLAFVVGTHERGVLADDGGDCPLEDQCTFKKPNILLIMDYSTSMNNLWDAQNNLTRWQVVVQSIETITQDGSFLSQNTHLALLRFGHDPAPAVAGTTIPNDGSGLVDGQKLDVPWYDDQNTPWLECNGAAIGAALDAAGDPIGGNLVGIGTWTKGALDQAKILIDQSIADHPEDAGARAYLNVVVTDGAWTGVDGTTTLAPAGQDPAITAAGLFDDQDVRTYVVAVAGDPAAEMAADSLATAGGTGPTAIDGDTPALLEQALGQLVLEIIDGVVAPECVGGLPRVMVLLDASSSMLNINGGTQAGGPGQTGWDKARDALAGEVDSLFDLELVDLPGQAVEDVVHLGLAVFGHNAPAPGEQRIVVDYGPCMKDNFAWALHPGSSAGCTPVDATTCSVDSDCGVDEVCRFGTCRTLCEGADQCGVGEVCAQGGCACNEDADCGQDGVCIVGQCHDSCSADPWGGPPIAWEFSDGTATPPGFDQATTSHMPQCAGNNEFCSGSGTYTHLGLAMIKANIANPACMQPNAPYPCTDQTQFVNILITDGQYTGYSTNAQVQAELEDMFGNLGVTTYVIGFGDGVDTPAAIAQLQSMADWGSGGALDYYDANNQAALEQALADIVAGISFDPCCAFNDCSANPEPTTGEPDPIPMEPDADTTTESTTEASTTTLGDESTTEEPTTTLGEESTTEEPTTSETAGESETSAGTSGGEDEIGTDAGTGSLDGVGDDGGDDCNCTSDPGSRGPLGSLLLLGLTALVRRRRG